MQLSTTESTFINMIKNPCIEKSKEYNILPSIMISIGAMISNWGTSKEFYATRNVYLLRINKSWNDKCYSHDSGKIYDKPDECDEPGAILYRVYTDHQNSVKDFIQYMATVRRSENGPLRYESLFGCTDYVEAIKRLDRSGFTNRYHISAESIQNAIENFNLYEYDKLEEDMSNSKKKHVQINASQNRQETVEDTEESVDEEKAVEEVVSTPTSDNIYRVRLDWDKRDTQIFASNDYEKALAEAKKHEGYKIYVGDDGELFEDPWIKVEEPVKEPDIDDILAESGINRIDHVIPGKKITLEKEALYIQATDGHPFMYVTGDFYYFNAIIVNNRARITKVQNTKNPNDIIGFINLK